MTQTATQVKSTAMPSGPEPSVGLVGVGMMGHGIALNLLKHGRKLAFLNHTGNQPVGDLLAAGAQAVGDLTTLAQNAEVIILCVTGSPEVESVLYGGGLLAALTSKHVLIDCSTALPSSTAKVSQAVIAQGAQFLDSPMTRTPKEAALGCLNLIVGGERALFEAQVPLLRCFAENITYAGPIGAGHQMKLLHNFVSMGFAAVLAEAAACAARMGVSNEVFVEILAKGGGDSVVLNRLRPYLENEDDSGFRFTLANAVKDMTYYRTMVEQAQAQGTMAQAVKETYETGLSRDSQATIPALITLLARD